MRPNVKRNGEDVMAKAKMNEEQKLARYGEVVGRYESASSLGKFYEVRCNAYGEKTCNCRGWIHHNHCWHVNSTENATSIKTARVEIFKVKKSR